MTRSRLLATATTGAWMIGVATNWSFTAPLDHSPETMRNLDGEPTVQPNTAPPTAATQEAVQALAPTPTDEPLRPSEPLPPMPPAFVLQIEESHGRDAWLRHSALQFDLMLVTDNGIRLQAAVLYDIVNRRSRITLPNKMSFVFDGKRTWSIPPDTPPPESPVFRGWSAIVALPFLLRGAGVLCEPQGVLTIEDKPLELARFTGLEIFHDEQRADEWCIVTAEADTHLIRSAICMVNVATGNVQGQRTSRPFGFALRFDDLVTLDEVTLPTMIRLSNWSAERGIDPNTALRAQVSNLTFLEPPADAFVEPTPTTPQPAP